LVYVKAPRRPLPTRDPDVEVENYRADLASKPATLGNFEPCARFVEATKASTLALGRQQAWCPNVPSLGSPVPRSPWFVTEPQVPQDPPPADDSYSSDAWATSATDGSSCADSSSGRSSPPADKRSTYVMEIEDDPPYDEDEDAPTPLDNGETSAEGMEGYVEVQPTEHTRLFRHPRGFLCNIKGQRCDGIGRLWHGRGCKGAGSRKWGEPRRQPRGTTTGRARAARNYVGLTSVPEQVLTIICFCC